MKCPDRVDEHPCQFAGGLRCPWSKCSNGSQVLRRVDGPSTLHSSRSPRVEWSSRLETAGTIFASWSKSLPTWMQFPVDSLREVSSRVTGMHRNRLESRWNRVRGELWGQWHLRLADFSVLVVWNKRPPILGVKFNAFGLWIAYLIL